MNQCTAFLDFVDECQCFAQNRTLLFRVIWRSEVVTHGCIDEIAARWFDLRREIEPGRHVHGGDIRLLSNPTNQTHGLVVEGSGRYRDHYVDFILH